MLDPLARLEVEANGGQSGTRRQALRGIFRPLLRPIESSKANQTREAAGGRTGAFLEHGAKNEACLQASGVVGAVIGAPSLVLPPLHGQCSLSVWRPKPSSMAWV